MLSQGQQLRRLLTAAVLSSRSGRALPPRMSCTNLDGPNPLSPKGPVQVGKVPGPAARARAYTVGTQGTQVAQRRPQRQNLSVTVCVLDIDGDGDELEDT